LLLLSLIACGAFVFGHFIIGGAFSYACAMIDASGSLYPLLIEFFTCIAWPGRFYLKELYIYKAGLNNWKHIKTPWNDFTGHRDIGFLLTMICCIAGYPLIPLIWMADPGNLLSSVKLYNFLNTLWDYLFLKELIEMFKIFDLNLWNYNKFDEWKLRIIEAIKKYDPDIIALQEARDDLRFNIACFKRLRGLK